jgi:hypothetical protein
MASDHSIGVICTSKHPVKRLKGSSSFSPALVVGNDTREVAEAKELREEIRDHNAHVWIEMRDSPREYVAEDRGRMGRWNILYCSVEVFVVLRGNSIA